MKTLEEFTKKWHDLPPYSGGYLLVSDEHPLAFHIGYTSDSQKSFVVFHKRKLAKITSSKAVAVENVNLTTGEYGLRFTLRYPSLDEIFIKLCWDLMESSRNTDNPEQKVADQYMKWLRLLQLAPEGLLQSFRQKGLIGELLYLKNKIEETDADYALDAWVGPEGSDQDFDFPDGWVEIKTTSISGDSISIASLEQLARLDPGKIVVFFMDATESHGLQSISLDEAVATVLQLLSTDKQRGVFMCKLAKVGYQEKDAESYNHHRFRCAPSSTYNVRDGFPRLTKDNICSGIVEASYRISLPSIEEFREQR